MPRIFAPWPMRFTILTNAAGNARFAERRGERYDSARREGILSGKPGIITTARARRHR